ncbi:hypothetical protein [Streptomyces sp. TRM68367]|uniref:hypothetical protein n=1 Tax=Streptomyces sp. TRM68367 TaxID=2758415 RepID=UPI0021D11107|nr:hypothetical protein [Streptomyces sp. TRM68367]
MWRYKAEISDLRESPFPLPLAWRLLRSALRCAGTIRPSPEFTVDGQHLTEVKSLGADTVSAVTWPSCTALHHSCLDLDVLVRDLDRPVRASGRKP